MATEISLIGISSMARLANLDLASNQISGEDPAALGSLLVPSLLNLGRNQISSQIPGAGVWGC